VAAVRAAILQLYFCNILTRYGRYSGLMLCGSCFGTVTWAARMMNLVYGYNGNSDLTDIVRSLSLFIFAHRWRAVLTVTYAIEFLCLSSALLMVLDRLSNFAAPQGGVMLKRWVLGGRILMAVVMLGNTVGLAGNIVSATHYQRSADALDEAISYFIANNIPEFRASNVLSQQEVERAASVSSWQAFCEVAVLLLIIAAFVAAGVLSARRISSRLLEVNDSSPAAVVGRTLRLRIVATTGFVFVAFLLRSVFSTMYAVAYQLQDLANRCPGINSPCTTTCHNVFTHIQQWLIHTPEFQLTIVLLSSPVALLVALWGMTNTAALLQRQTLQAESQSQRHTSSVSRSVQSHSGSVQPHSASAA
jgi:hypothetical protein